MFILVLTHKQNATTIMGIATKICFNVAKVSVMCYKKFPPMLQYFFLRFLLDFAKNNVFSAHQ
jgi:hypothetical protein